MRVLIIGDLRGQLAIATELAQKNGAQVNHTKNIDDGISTLRSGSGAELVMIDVTCDIKKLVDLLLAEHINIPVIACGLNDNAEDAVKAIKAGAKEYVPLPPDEELIAMILSAITEESYDFICQSEAMKNVMKIADQIAPSEANVLITGESGTGKEMIARYIHNKSKRAKELFVTVNCAAIPENLMESELFGHEKGAFTGAVARRIGKFEESNNGTLLLDEISEMAVHLQAKLLRAIQEKEIDRVGGKQPVKINLRVLATSNRDLKEEVKAGNFREDLLFRLNIIHLKVPPLRERKGDIVPFVDFFNKKYSDLNGLPLKPFSEEALNAIKAYSWPGNVRELENTIHRAILLNQSDEVQPESLLFDEDHSPTDANTQSNAADVQVGQTIEAMEKDLILKTLDHCLGNRTHAANILGISIRTLRNKLKNYAE